MEVEDLLEDGKNEKVEDAEQIVGCIPTEGTLFGKPHVEISNGCYFLSFFFCPSLFFCYYDYSLG